MRSSRSRSARRSACGPWRGGASALKRCAWRGADARRARRAIAPDARCSMFARALAYAVPRMRNIQGCILFLPGVACSNRPSAIVAGVPHLVRRGPIMGYQLEGRLLEVCNCRGLCPCWIGEDPDFKTCDTIVAWHFDKGKINGVDVSDRTIALIAHVPGN